MSKNALIVVDVQNDFCDGNLSVDNAETIIPVINKIKNKFDRTIFSKDWHPFNHSSFKKMGGLWPDHCIQSERGSLLHNKLKVDIDDEIVYKGIYPESDSYSAFYIGNNEKTRANDILKNNGIKNVYVCGLATDYCVKATAEDSIKFGYNTYLVKDASCPLNVNYVNNCYQSLAEIGVDIIDSRKL